MASPSPGPRITPPAGRLNSWKEIAAYLGREVRTVQRWEESAGLPVHRLQHEKGTTVYALIVELDEWLLSRSARSENTAEPEPLEVAVLPGNKPKVAPRVYWIAGFALLSIAVGVGFWSFRTPDSGQGQLRVPVPLTSAPGSEYAPRLSPDGRSVAYSRVVGQGVQAVVQRVEEEAPAVLGDPKEVSYSPVWSFQGDFVAFLSAPQWSEWSPINVIVKPALGGVERKLADVRVPLISMIFAPGPYLDWSPDGQYVVACDKVDPRPEHCLTLISTKTGKKTQLTTPPFTAWGDYCPRFSPDGRRIVFTRTTNYGAGRLYTLDLTSDMRPAGPPVQLPTSHLWNAFPAWSPDARQIIFAGGTLDHATPRLIRADGSAPDTPAAIAALGVGPMDMVRVRDSKDLRFVFNRVEVNDDILRMSLQAGNPPQEDTGVPRIRLIDSSYRDDLPQYSPDGAKIAFLSDRTGQGQLWICRADGTEARQITHFDEAQLGLPAWSPDGTQLILTVQTKDDTAIDIIDTSTGQSRRLVTDADSKGGPSWSPDGRWIYFSSKKDGYNRIWKIPAQGGDWTEVLTVKAGAPRLTPDSKYLVYNTGAEASMIPLAGGGTAKLLFPKLYSIQAINITKSGVLALVPSSTPGSPYVLSFFNFADEKIYSVAQIVNPIGNGLSIAPDGRSVLFVERRNVIADIMMVDKLKLPF